MAGKSKNASRARLVAIGAQHKPVRRGAGNLVFAGNYWPPKVKNSVKYHDARTSITEARKIVIQGYLAASAACKGNTKYIPIMERWFGVRPNGAKGSTEDWWEGARRIIGVIEGFLTSNVNIYYRGDNSILGKPNDYPNETGNLGAYDIVGYAETAAGSLTSNIGLCGDFFAKRASGKGAGIKLRGFDSVGGVLVHELSHNLCRTEDHSFNGHDCYGTGECQGLAASNSRGHRAWWNADNIEYFCEEVGYPGQQQQHIATSATRSVSDLAARFGG